MTVHTCLIQKKRKLKFKKTLEWTKKGKVKAE